MYSLVDLFKMFNNFNTVIYQLFINIMIIIFISYKIYKIPTDYL